MDEWPNGAARDEMVHDLRLSLAVLSGYLQLLQREHQLRGFEGPRAVMFTDHLLTETAQLSRLLDRFERSSGAD